MAAVVSSHQILPLLRARRAHEFHARLSPDLGLSEVNVILEADGFLLPDGVRVAWSDAEKIARDENSCFVLNANGISKIKTFSELTNRAYSLFPTASAPTMLVAGFPMHRIQDITPERAASAMAKTLAPLSGNVLDTATGLGYTAIEMAKTARQVITIELDPTAQEIARQNPWSRELFTNPNIEQRMGDSFEIVPSFDANYFDAILHDPPTMSLAGDLYSQEFYRELFRVLRRGGKLFHYIGDPESKFGANTTRGVMQRLKNAGFRTVKPARQAFGVLALK